MLIIVIFVCVFLLVLFCEAKKSVLRYSLRKLQNIPLGLTSLQANISNSGPFKYESLALNHHIWLAFTSVINVLVVDIS
jgi:hypothetical protein